MQRTIHIAMSLDGYIADQDGSIEWLETAASDPTIGDRVLAFITASDLIVMGRLTYDFVSVFPEWPYPNKNTIVVSDTLKAATTPDTQVVRREDLRSAIAATGAQNIWIVGGGQLNSFMLDEGMVDVLVVTVVPILLGSGRPLFTPLQTHHHLKMLESHPLPEGFFELTYAVLPR